MAELNSGGFSGHEITKLCRLVAIHCFDLDEDISVEGLLPGAKSGESQASLSKWLVARQTVGGKGKRRK